MKNDQKFPLFFCYDGQKLNSYLYAEAQGMTTKPNVKAITRWVHALRSPKYRNHQQRTVEIMLDQKIGQDSGGFSALGVLCDILDPNGWQWSEGGYLRHEGCLLAPSVEFIRRHGIPATLAAIVREMSADGKSLGAVANYLERKYLNLGDKRFNRFPYKIRRCIA